MEAKYFYERINRNESSITWQIFMRWMCVAHRQNVGYFFCLWYLFYTYSI